MYAILFLEPARDLVINAFGTVFDRNSSSISLSHTERETPKRSQDLSVWNWAILEKKQTEGMSAPPPQPWDFSFFYFTLGNSILFSVSSIAPPLEIQQSCVASLWKLQGQKPGPLALEFLLNFLLASPWKFYFAFS